MSGIAARTGTPVSTGPVEGSREGPLKVVICTATRNRRKMLASLLFSLSKIRVPEDVTTAFVVVENDAVPRSEAQVAASAAGFAPGTLHYVQEPVIGIPFARNRAIETALSLNADAMLFVDDDEIVTETWLQEMVAEYRRSGAHLIGGPVRTRFEDAPQGWMEKMLRAGIRDRFDRVANRAERRAARGQFNRITVITANWLASAELFREHGLTFDTVLGANGTEDTQFYREVRALGLKTGWARKAVVYETIPLERLSPRYQFFRGREQSTAHARCKIRDLGWWTALGQAVPVSLAQGLGVLAGALTVPISGGRTLLTVARSAGKLTGRARAFAGAQSRLYVKTTGH